MNEIRGTLFSETPHGLACLMITVPESFFNESKIFKDAVNNAPTQDSFEIYRETVSLKDQQDFILQQFNNDKILSLKNLVKKLETKLEIIVTFLALLEMIKRSEIICSQKENFEDIEIKLIIAEA